MVSIAECLSIREEFWSDAGVVDLFGIDQREAGELSDRQG
jgi:hypothetical protein